MNFVKTSRFFQPKSIANKWKQVRFAQRKPNPPLAKKNVPKEEENNFPVKVEKIQRDIFGATILPQNLSFENTKKLSENQIRLEDIPLVDENEVAEVMVAEKMKIKKSEVVKEPKKAQEDFGVIVVQTELLKRPRELKKSVAELFCVADPYEAIPGPKIFRNATKAVKQFVKQLTLVSLFRLMKTNALTYLKAYGPVVKLPEILGGKIILISRPEHMSAVFEQDQRYPVNSVLDSIQRSRSQRRNKYEYHLTEEWEEIRKTIDDPMIKDFDMYFDTIDEASSKLVRRIKAIRNRQNEVPDNFLFEINKWSLECLCCVLFDKPFGFLDECMSRSSKTSQLLYSLTVATRHMCHLESGFQFWRFVNTSSLSSLNSACEILERIISEYVGQVQLSMLKRQQDSADLRKVSLIEWLLLQEDFTPDQIVSIILDTLVIGTNTMSTSLGFLLYHLCQNPRVQSELWKEVKEILPEKYSRLECEQINSFRYLQACLKESLRLKMPMPVLTRVLSSNVILNNYQIPKGTFVLMTAQVEGLKPENFDDPTEFIPERWLDQDSTHPFAILPVRNYFEDSFERRVAEASIWVCASQIFRHFFVEYFYGDIEATSTAISFPNKPLKFTFVDRRE